MDQVRVVVVIEQAAAIRAGKSQYGRAVVTVDPEQLTEAERAELSLCRESNTSYESPERGALDPRADDSSIITRQPEPTMDAVRDLMAAHREWRLRDEAERKARREKAYSEYVAKCSDPENWIGGNSNDPKIEKPYTYLSEQEFAAEVQSLPSSIAARTEAEKKVKMAQDARRAELEAQIADWMREPLEKLVYKKNEKWQSNVWTKLTDMSPDLTARVNEAILWAQQQETESAARRKNQLDRWVVDQGNANQQGRHKLGLLPEDEILDAIRADVYQPLDNFNRYEKLEASDVDHDDDCYNSDVDFAVEDAPTMNAEQFDTYTKIQMLVPAATLTPRKHTAECSTCHATETRYSLRVAITMGELNFTREYAL